MGIRLETKKRKLKRLTDQECISWKDNLFLNNEEEYSKKLYICATLIFFVSIIAVFLNVYNILHYLTIIIYIYMNGNFYNQKKIIFWNFTAIKLIDLAMRGIHTIFYIQLSGLIVFIMYSIYDFIISQFGYKLQMFKV
ncbi:hypothetical protein GVAV_001159 [Gurleya vavrai]